MVGVVKSGGGYVGVDGEFGEVLEMREEEGKGFKGSGRG